MDNAPIALGEQPEVVPQEQPIQLGFSLDTMPPVTPEVARTRAAKGQMGLSPFWDKSVMDVYNGLLTGRERELRQEGAAAVERVN
jgi:hypothetical protein